jgi:hypothetical protein
MADAVPEWFNHWHLASLLRRSQQVEYLGRLRVALPHGSASAERIHVEDALAEVLETAGAPLELEELASFANQMNARLAGDFIVARAPSAAAPAEPATQPQSDEIDDPPRAQLPLEQAIEILRAYRAPPEPRLEPELAARVTEMIDSLLSRESADEIPLIDNYIDGKLHYLGFSPTPWHRELGRTAYALRQLQLRERAGE